jgi:cytosine/adenosine deaminase-related metal-dependent hydrolase
VKTCYKVSALYENSEIKRDVNIVVNEYGVIEDIGQKVVLDTIDREVELDGIVFPTFVNAHAHLELSNFVTGKQKIPLWDWILEIVHKKRALNPNDYKIAIEEGFNFFSERHIGCIGDIRSVLPNEPFFDEYRANCIVFYEVLGYVENLFNEKFEQLKSFLKHYNGRKGISVHSLYTTPLSKAKAVLEYAKSWGLPVMMHLGETEYESRLLFNREIEGFKKIFSTVNFEYIDVKSYREILEKLRLSSNDILVHCVEFKEEDWDYIAKNRIKVVLCPMSNLFWSDKLPDIDCIIEKGIEFAIGTDSPATNASLDILKDGDLLIRLSKDKERAKRKVFLALTYMGRKILGFSMDVFCKGAKFDCLFVRNAYDEDTLLEYLFVNDKIIRINGAN